MRRNLVLLVFGFLLATVSAFPKSGSTGSSRGSHASGPYGGSTVHVNGYYRKDGTYVHSYDRHSAGTSVNGDSSSSYISPNGNYPAAGYTLDPTVSRHENGKTKRSPAAKNEFKREHSCPSTGRSSGGCPGYVVDHVRPLECGGADSPSNMQWQTVAEGTAKDRTERYCR